MSIQFYQFAGVYIGMAAYKGKGYYASGKTRGEVIGKLFSRATN